MQPQVEPRFKTIVDIAEKSAAQKQGKRNRDAGLRFQRKARKMIERLLGKQAARFKGQLGNEESWHGFSWRIECKYNAKNNPVVTSYEKAREQSEGNHAIGDPRPFVFVTGTAYGRTVAVIELDHDLALVAETITSAPSEMGLE